MVGEGERQGTETTGSETRQAGECEGAGDPGGSGSSGSQGAAGGCPGGEEGTGVARRQVGGLPTGGGGRRGGRSWQRRTDEGREGPRERAAHSLSLVDNFDVRRRGCAGRVGAEFGGGGVQRGSTRWSGPASGRAPGGAFRRRHGTGEPKAATRSQGCGGSWTTHDRPPRGKIEVHGRHLLRRVGGSWGANDPRADLWDRGGRSLGGGRSTGKGTGLQIHLRLGE